MTKVIFKSTSTLINKITKLRDEIQKNLTKRTFTSFAKPDRGFIHMFTSERGCMTREKLGHKQKTIQNFHLQTKTKVLFTLKPGAIEGTGIHTVQVI